LQAPGASSAGVHINEFVPGIGEAYKVIGLKTRVLAQLVEGPVEL